jgi:GMP synthase-like glutamine amidotransferase
MTIGHNSFDSHPWIVRLVEFIRGLLKPQERIRVSGICFGHQIVARVLGAEVGRNYRGWEVSVVQVNLTDGAVSVFGPNLKHIVSAFEYIQSLI